MPDFERYATGWRWLDWLTTPYWRIAGWWVERKWWLAHARPGESWQEARDRNQPKYAAALAESYARRVQEQARGADTTTPNDA